MFALTFAQLSTLIGQFWWPFLRILAALITMPIFSSVLISNRLKLLLAMFLTLLVGPFIHNVPAIDPFSLSAIGLTLQQLLIGVVFGFGLVLFFTIFTMAGQIVSTQMGLSLGSMNDPVNGVSVTVLGNIYQAAVILLFFKLNGHLLALQILINSFQQLPIGLTFFNSQQLMLIPHMAAWIFGSALLLILPAVTAMLLVNIAFGLMYRAAPQLNIYSLGFPMNILLGVVIIALTFNSLPSQFNQLFEHLLGLLNQLMGGR